MEPQRVSKSRYSGRILSYYTIREPVESELVDRRSRFLAVAERVGTEAAAHAVIDAQRRTHPQARHHCSAYVIGADADLRRSNDAGEPGGTAGTPILEAITGAGYSDVVIVVTRWFGGTLLGSGGLIRAYGRAAADALTAASPVERRRATVLLVRCGYEDSGVLTRLLYDTAQVLDTAYDAEVVFRVVTLTPGDLRENIGAMASGRADVTIEGHAWLDA